MPIVANIKSQRTKNSITLKCYRIDIIISIIYIYICDVGEMIWPDQRGHLFECQFPMKIRNPQNDTEL